jgi:hypothetical protein
MRYLVKPLLIILAVCFLLAAAFYGSIIWLFSNPDCHYDAQHAQKRVESFLKQYELHESGLRLIDFDSESCRADFVYVIEGKSYEILVINDFVKGAKVTGDLSDIINHGT